MAPTSGFDPCVVCKQPVRAFRIKRCVDDMINSLVVATSFYQYSRKVMGVFKPA